MHKTLLPFDKVPQLSKTDVAYATGDPSLRPFYQYEPRLESFGEALENKKRSEFPRDTLAEVLRAQYARLPEQAKVSENIESLRKGDTFTVATAHQPSLFLGPLYFLYKALTTINLAEAVEEKTRHRIVPVFVLGSEDHDLEELNSIHLFNKKLVWRSSEKGAVGSMGTAGLAPVLAELKTILGESEAATALFARVERAYTESPTIADATRALLHDLFGRYGLVVLNMNDAQLKRHFIPVLKAELTEQPSFKIVNETIERLNNLGFKTQAAPREINLFYMKPGLRERIVAAPPSPPVGGLGGAAGLGGVRDAVSPTGEGGASRLDAGRAINESDIEQDKSESLPLTVQGGGDFSKKEQQLSKSEAPLPPVGGLGGSARYQILNTGLVFSQAEILAEVEQHPERFSPNVVLRPLYQEMILPNLAYIGGGGELAYWLERKALFQHFGVPLPVLVRRHSVLWLDRDAVKKLQKFGFTPAHFFEDTDALLRSYVEKHAAGEVSLEQEISDLRSIFDRLAAKATAIDPTLEGAVRAEEVKSVGSLEQWHGRLIRAEKQKHEVVLNQVRAGKDKYFPGGGLQERHDNFMPYMLKYGDVFIETLKANLAPFDSGFVVLEDL